MEDVYRNRRQNNRFTYLASLLVESELIRIDWVNVPAETIHVTVPLFRRRLPLSYVMSSQLPSDLKVHSHPYIS